MSMWSPWVPSTFGKSEFSRIPRGEIIGTITHCSFHSGVNDESVRETFVGDEVSNRERDGERRLRCSICDELNSPEEPTSTKKTEQRYSVWDSQPFPINSTCRMSPTLG